MRATARTAGRQKKSLTDGDATNDEGSAGNAATPSNAPAIKPKLDENRLSSDPQERQADDAAAAVVAGEPVSGIVDSPAGTAGIQRKSEDPHPTIVTAAVASAVATGPTVLVDDRVQSVTPGQVRKRDFLARLEPALKSAASAELGPLWSVAGCPYITRYLAIYAQRPASETEQFVRKYTGSKAVDPEQLMNDLVARVRIGVRHWRDTGNLPDDIAAIDPDTAEAARKASAKAPAGTLQRKGEHGDEPPAMTGAPEQVLQQLGEGAPMDSATQARMSDAFGTSFADVRIHADPEGAALARQHSALAFAVGSHIAFASGKYQPGTVEGDALLAHELTHVLQQRGADPSGPQKKSETTPGDAAEQDADRGAAAAVGQLHGGPGTKTERPTAKVNSDLQLARCVSTAHAPGIDRGFHQERYTWDGDPFEITLKIVKNPTADQSWHLRFNIEYVGEDDSDGFDPSFSLQTVHKQPEPSVKTDEPDGWAKLDVDLYGDASWIGSLKHESTLIDGWNPKTRKHSFSGKAPSEDNGPRDVFIKTKDALPGTTANTSVMGDTDTRALRIDLAAITTKRWFDEIVNDATYGLDPKAAPWATLRLKIDADFAKYGSSQEKNPDEALRLTRLGEALERAKPMLRALGAASKPEAYLPDIASDALAMIADVRHMYEDAIGASWDGPPNAKFVAADKQFNTVWFRINSLYLESGRGADKMLDDAHWAANDVHLLRGPDRGGIYYPELEGLLGVPPSRERDTLVKQATEQRRDVRDDFIAGKTGSMPKIAKVVEDAQLAMGLAALLCTNEVFHSFKREMSGIVGGAADTLGRDLSAVCDGYIGQFEGLAGSVEGELKSGADLHAVGPGVVAKFQGIVASDQFKKDLDAIKSRIKTVKVLETLAKVLAIVGVAALTAGAAGAAIGGALQGAGASAAAVATGSFAAEVVTFTIVSRLGNEAVFGKNDTGLGEDLVTNALMFGFLKGAASAYGRVFKVIADPKAHKVAYAVGGAATGMVALQSFAEVHHRLKAGKWMDGDERLSSVISNAVMLVALSLGGYLAKPLNQRIKSNMLVFTAKHTPGRLAAVEAKIAAAKGEVDALRGQDPVKSADRAAELLGKIEKLWNEELGVLADAAKAEKAKRVEASKAFQETVDSFVKEIAKVDLQLAAAGLEANLGPNKAANYFRPLSPGFVTYRPEALEILKDFYKDNGGRFEQIKEGVYAGKARGEETFFIADSAADSFFNVPSAKPPTAKEAAANHAQAERAYAENAKRGRKVEELLLRDAEDGHVRTKLGRVIEGNGLAAAQDANTLPGSQRGDKPAPLTSIPGTIGVGTGKETFRKLGDTSIGQAAPEFDSAGWAEGAAPRDFTPSHGTYASASTIADAVALTQYRSGVPVLDGSVLEVSLKPDASWKVSDAKVRIKVRLKSGAEVYLYTDATDIATGLGAPNSLEAKQINADPATEARYKAALESTLRLVYGDQVGAQRGGDVLVSGGSATAAWNARVARELGANVDWIARDTRDKAPPRNEAASREYAKIQDKLDAGGLSAPETEALMRRQAELRAFDAAMLPRNVQPKDAAFNDAGIKRAVKEITSMTPTEEIAGEPPGKVKVTFSDGSKGMYDQVVASHGTNVGTTATGGPTGKGPSGALTLAQGMELQPVIVNGQVVALETVNPPGAVRILGSAMWSPRWIDFIVPSQQAVYKEALSMQALGSPRDSPANPLIHNVGMQIPAANTKITK